MYTALFLKIPSIPTQENFTFPWREREPFLRHLRWNREIEEGKVGCLEMAWPDRALSSLPSCLSLRINEDSYQIFPFQMRLIGPPTNRSLLWSILLFLFLFPLLCLYSNVMQCCDAREVGESLLDLDFSFLHPYPISLSHLWETITVLGGSGPGSCHATHVHLPTRKDKYWTCLQNFQVKIRVQLSHSSSFLFCFVPSSTLENLINIKNQAPIRI